MSKSTKRKGHYASPGEDDRYLRPRSGQRYAPRQIAVCQHEEETWVSWIHYVGGKDHLVVGRDWEKGSGTSRWERGSGTFSWEEKEPDPARVPDPARGEEVRLTRLAGGDGRRFGRPALVGVEGAGVEVFCAVHGDGGVSIAGYRREGKRWAPLEGSVCGCDAVYDLDAVAGRDGEVVLAYSGVSTKRGEAQVFTQRRRGGKWEKVERHGGAGRWVSRPKLAADSEGRVSVIADAYGEKGYEVVWKPLEGGAKWTRVSSGDGWNLFPSMVADREGRLWASWLSEYPVRRKDVMGMWQEARVARLEEGRWTEVQDRGGAAATLNLGLLPIKRYFGYDGLRRYPRLAAMADGSVWLLWEQQKGEEEVWDHVRNGFLCAKRCAGRTWSATAAVIGEGVCHTFDAKRLHDSGSFALALKGEHRSSGADFEVREVDLGKVDACSLPARGRWKDWRRETLPKARGRRRGIEGGWRLYWGDLHCHSFFSPDAEGEPDELFHFARDAAGLDFACVIDNDVYPDKALLDSEVGYTAALAKAMTREGAFVGLSGYEWTYHRRDAGRSFNHRIVIFTGEDRAMARRNEPTGRTEKAFMEHVAGSSNISIAHHARWRLGGIANECAVEVTSGWGTYILDAPTVHEALAKGHRFGFTGNGDSHRFLPGLAGALTGVYAKDLTKEAIVEALRAQRTIATTGNRTGVALWVNGVLMGGEAVSEGAPRVRWRVWPAGEIERVEVIRDGEAVMGTERPAGEWSDEGAEPGEHWYTVRVKERGRHKRYPHNIAPAWGKWAWTSPVWVRRA